MTPKQEKIYRVADSYAAVELASDDFRGVVSILNTKTVERKNSDLKTTRWLMLEFPNDLGGGVTESDIILGTLQKSTIPRVAAAYAAMNADGINMSDPQVQTMIEILSAANGWPAGLSDRVKAKGIWYIEPWRAEGLGELPTIQEISDAKAAKVKYDQDQINERNRKVLEGRAKRALGNVLIVISQGNGTTTNTELINAFQTGLS